MRQRDELLAREHRAVRRILRAYAAAERAVEAEIRRFQDKQAQALIAGMPMSPSWLYQEARLENILREIRMRIDEFSRDAYEFAVAARDDAYRLGAVHAVKLAAVQVYGDVAGLAAGALEAGQAAMAAGSPLRALFDDLGPAAAQSARRLFAEAAALGWNPRRTGDELAREIERLGRDRAVLIARTEAIRAYRIANREVYLANRGAVAGWRWTAAKTPATCALCLAMDGEVFPVTEVLQSHPACRCAMVPVPGTDFGGPEMQTGEEYFRQLPPREQDRILGRTKAEMYRAGELTLRDNVRWEEDPLWGRAPAPKTIKQIREERTLGQLPSQRGIERLSPFNPRRRTFIVPQAPEAPPRGAASALVELRGYVPETMRRELEEAIEAIDRLHRAPPARPVVVRGERGGEPHIEDVARGRVPVYVRSLRSLEGSYRSVRLTDGANYPAEIEIDANSRFPALTFAHEYGHMLDELISKTGQAASERNERFIEAWRRTKLCGRLRRAYENRAIRAEYYAYLDMPDEVFARAYSQWAAVRSGGRMLEQLRRRQAELIPTQWADDDFEEMARAVEEILREAGLL
jgi:hypothetical protein